MAEGLQDVMEFNDTTINVAVIGSGGREAVIAQLMAESDFVDRTFVYTGNGGTHEHATRVTDVNLYPSNGHAEFIQDLKRRDISFLIIGPEQPLVDGLADKVREHYITVLGASKDAAQLEGSKIIAREFMERNNIPIPDYHLFDVGTAEAKKADALSYTRQQFENQIPGLVIKADGLCGGKGAIVCRTYQEVEQALTELQSFGKAGEKFLIEEMMQGPEISVTVLVGDNGKYVVLPFSQDYKRALDGDQGKNTGGMGAVTVDLPDSLKEIIDRTIIKPTIDGAKKEGISLARSILYIGLMLTTNANGEVVPKVVEYNCRLGDPEAQVVLPKVKDAARLLYEVAQGCIPKEVEFGKEHYATVAHVDVGYPEAKLGQGQPIEGIDEARHVEGVHQVVIAGTQCTFGDYIVHGTRNVYVTGKGSTVKEAVANANAGSEKIRSKGLRHRTDIGCNVQAIRNLVSN